MNTLRTLGADLHSQYVPAAIYYADADTVEYMRRDTSCLHRRIDGILTLVLDLKTRELVGFRVKGFKNFFIKHLKPKYELLDGDFIALVSVLEQALEIVGKRVCPSRDSIEAYRSARKMALEDRVALEPLAA
ncbi:MAG: hypothetical protein WBF58_15405 [Xanthobacteraceae bacterium]